MRTHIFCIAGLMALLLAAPAKAQRGLHGQLGIGIGAGFVDGMSLCNAEGAGRYALEASLVRYNRNHSYWNVTASLLRKDYRYESVAARQIVPMAQFALEAGYNHPLLADRRRNVTLFASLVALTGYETVGWGDKHLRDGALLRSDDAFIYGAQIAASVEAYLADRVILLVRMRERCAFGSPTGEFHTLVTLGIRIIIN